MLNHKFISMKKHLLFISTLLISTFSFAQYEGFENWTQNTVDALLDYETMVYQSPLIGSSTTIKSTDAFTGNYSIRLETVLSSSNDTAFGYFLSGDPDNNAPGQAVTLPFPGAIDSIVGWYKYDIMPNDSAVFLAQAFGLGSPTGGGVYYIKGQQPTWKRFAYAVEAPGSDSLMVAAASSDALNDYNGVPGTWIQFDDIQLKGPSVTANILNYSFENWTTISWDNPDGWNTANDYAFNASLMPAVKTIDSYAGSFALELNTITNDEGDTIGGIASNGTFDQNGFVGGTPYTADPIGIEFYYKNSLTGIDTSWASIAFKNNGSTILQTGSQLAAVGTYTMFSQMFSLPMTPDTILLGVYAGENPGSSLLIDNIDFIFPVGITEEITVEELVTYPNPVTDLLKIRFNIKNNNEVSIRLIDAVCKELVNLSLGSLTSGIYRESFNTSNFSNGVYFLEFTLGTEKIVERFIVE
jgi:hypothetical protein